MLNRPRELTRHALVALSGGTLMWLVNRLVLPVFAQLPGNESRVAEWLASHPQHSPLVSFIQFLVIAGLLSWTQEIRRPGMFRLSLLLSPLAGLGLLALELQRRATSKVSSPALHSHAFWAWPPPRR